MRAACYAIRARGEQCAFVAWEVDRRFKRLFLIAGERRRPMRQRVSQSLLLHAKKQQREKGSEQRAMRSGHNGGVVVFIA